VQQITYFCVAESSSELPKNITFSPRKIRHTSRSIRRASPRERLGAANRLEKVATWGELGDEPTRFRKHDSYITKYDFYIATLSLGWQQHDFQSFVARPQRANQVDRRSGIDVDVQHEHVWAASIDPGQGRHIRRDNYAAFNPRLFTQYGPKTNLKDFVRLNQQNLDLAACGLTN